MSGKTPRQNSYLRSSTGETNSASTKLHTPPTEKAGAGDSGGDGSGVSGDACDLLIDADWRASGRPVCAAWRLTRLWSGSIVKAFFGPLYASGRMAWSLAPCQLSEESAA
jgi:hypothetical protein